MRLPFTDSDPFVVASVAMPEKGVFQIRAPEDTMQRFKVGARVLATLDYGLDCGEWRGAVNWDPAANGPQPPHFRFVRAFGDDSKDGVREAENAKRAVVLAQLFAEHVHKAHTSFHVVSQRLAFGGGRLFVHYLSENGKLDLSAACLATRATTGVSVQAWPIGPREAASRIGGIGFCGRVCCCATWQERAPFVQVPPSESRAAALRLNGICGRYKCCLAFEADE